jgi:tRNA 2-thiouridine synthesizing protein A
MLEMDLSGFKCPMPVILANRRLADLSDGDVLVVTATDPLARHDFRDYCRSAGHTLLKMEKKGKAMRFHLQKKNTYKTQSDPFAIVWPTTP